MAIALWEDKAQQFLGTLHETPSVPAFIVVCGLLPKSFAGNVFRNQLLVHNTINTISGSFMMNIQLFISFNFNYYSFLESIDT